MNTNTDIDQPTTSASTALLWGEARHDMYGAIHKALRSFMMDTLGRVGRLDVFDPEDMDATLGQLDALLTECTSHVKHENEFVHPAIEARRPLGTERIAGEHVEHLAVIASLRKEARYLRTANAALRMSLAHRLYQHLASFVAENFEHMHYEETVHNRALWALYTDAELEAIHGRLMESIPPVELLGIVRWMVPALTPVERIGMLRGLQAEVPPSAFKAVIDQVRPHLDAVAWGKLAPALGIPARGAGGASEHVGEHASEASSGLASHPEKDPTSNGASGRAVAPLEAYA